jgi:hypothetical protein
MANSLEALMFAGIALIVLSEMEDAGARRQRMIAFVALCVAVAMVVTMVRMLLSS